ncbi:MAG: hypothetical protein PHD81_00155 [Candidatus Nanoarchaeia archaeon]|nr:hypothetical protein [Candidatus Nanoarchaeia archaeon]MDD5587504.1 hypothetical protein [Candidatus Nanoarchaeia archaeon]
MEKEVKNNIIGILDKSYKAILDKDIKLLRDLSNHTLHSASIAQDPDSISVAVMVYSFSKIFERNYNEYKDWDKFYSLTKDNLKLSIKYLRKNDSEAYETAMKNILYGISNLDEKLRDYIQEVFEEAKINKASRIYEHGISLARTAELLGITQWELMNYVGTTGISDVPLSRTISIKERMNYARKVFE